MTNRGGKRENAGRIGIGTTKKVTLTLENETWEQLKDEMERRDVKQSALIRDAIENHLDAPTDDTTDITHVDVLDTSDITTVTTDISDITAIDQRSSMWWELVRKNVSEGFIEVKKNEIKDCINHRRYDASLVEKVWQRCVENSNRAGYKQPKIFYLLEGFSFEGKRLLRDDLFGSLKEQILFPLIEYVRKS